MPELFRFYGFLFFFYSREHEPIHVHVEGAGGILEVVEDNKDIIIKRWNEHFKKNGTNNQDMV